MGIIQASIPLFFVLIAVELLSARLGRRRLYRLNDALSDLSAGTLSQIAGIFTKVLLVGAYGWTFEHARLQRLSGVPAWPDGATWGVANVIGWTAAFFAVDLAYYWFHRVSHEVNLFWAGHIVHHSSEEYNLAVALRQTAVGGVVSWIFYVPLAIAGMTLEQFAVCYAINLVYQFWIHTRAIAQLPRWAEAVLNTPSHHRVHHGVNPAYQDRNYAGVFIIWDKWFGTFTPENEEPVYGLTSPLRSWNPLWAQVHHYVAIARAVRRAPTWRERWMRVFGAPGWRPARDGGAVVIPPVNAASFVKYDPSVPTVLSNYALVHFALAIPAALWLLARAESLSSGELAAGAFYVVLTLTNVGGIFEARRWASTTERARLLALAAACGVLIVRGTITTVFGALGIAIACVSFAVVWNARGAFTTSSDERMDHAYRNSGNSL